MAAAKRKQDEKHLKVLREMVSLPHNKFCFDCHQRGPTYVNMTIGSYVCTACSGILRGLNPPHRVKSISMTSFSSDDMEFLQSRGNGLCNKTWLGLYDAKAQFELDTKDEQKVKDYMAQKYEKKRWYIPPTEVMFKEAKVENASKKEHKTQTKNSNAISKLPLQVPRNNTPTTVNQSPPIAVTTEASSHKNDLLTQLGDPFGNISGPSNAESSVSSFPANFTANFSTNSPLNNFLTPSDLVSQPITGPPGSTSTVQSNISSFPVANGIPVLPPANLPSSTLPATQFLNDPKQSVSQNANTLQPNSSITSTMPSSNSAPNFPPTGDKYAALADLDSLLGSSNADSVKWDSSFGGVPVASSLGSQPQWASLSSSASMPGFPAFSVAGGTPNPFDAGIASSVSPVNPFVGVGHAGTFPSSSTVPTGVSQASPFLATGGASLSYPTNAAQQCGFPIAASQPVNMAIGSVPQGVFPGVSNPFSSIGAAPGNAAGAFAATQFSSIDPSISLNAQPGTFAAGAPQLGMLNAAGHANPFSSPSAWQSANTILWNAASNPSNPFLAAGNFAAVPLANTAGSTLAPGAMNSMAQALPQQPSTNPFL